MPSGGCGPPYSIFSRLPPRLSSFANILTRYPVRISVEPMYPAGLQVKPGFFAARHLAAFRFAATSQIVSFGANELIPCRALYLRIGRRILGTTLPLMTVPHASGAFSVTACTVRSSRMCGSQCRGDCKKRYSKANTIQYSVAAGVGDVSCVETHVTRSVTERLDSLSNQFVLGRVSSSPFASENQCRRELCRNSQGGIGLDCDQSPIFWTRACFSSAAKSRSFEAYR